MFNLSSYLEKFKNLKDPKENKTIIARILFETTQVSIGESEITIKGETLYLQSSALSKSRVFTQKEQVIRKINEAIPDLHIREVI